MLRHVAVGIAGLAAIGFAGQAMAQAPSTTENVTVNISVAPTVSLWVNDDTIDLVLDGSGPANAAAVADGLNILNNVVADVNVGVVGSLPAPIVGGGGINFFIFGNQSDAANIVTQLNTLPSAGTLLSAYNPVGALVWNYAILTTGPNPDQLLISNTPIHTSALPYPVIYAADAPGELPLVTLTPWSLTVTYTISDST